MMNTDLTRGPIVPVLLKFTLPFLLASFLQTFYGMADLFIVGQFCDTASINAVSVGSQFMHMVTVVIIGMASGITVAIGHKTGEQKLQEINPIIQSGLWLFGILALAGTSGLLALGPAIVSLLQTPVESAAGCLAYLQVCFAGLAFIIAYNVFASVFRGLGDSKSPMYFVFISCLLNIALDYVFVGAMNLSVAGAAWATVIAQGISAAIALVMLKRREYGFEVVLLAKKVSAKGMAQLIRLGGPVAAQDGFIQVSFLIITMMANSRGLVFATSVGITEKIISFFFLVPSAFLASLAAITAQNYGAGRYFRAQKTLYAALSITFGYGLLCFVLCQFVPQFFIALFTRDQAVIAAGGDYLQAYSLDCAFAGIHFCFSGYFMGIGKPVLSFIHNVISVILVRIPVSYLAMVLFPASLYPMGLAAPLGSALSALICIFFYFRFCRHLRQTQLEIQPEPLF